MGLALCSGRTWTNYFPLALYLFFPSQNPGAGFLLGSVTVYMDSYRRARLGSAALHRRYNVRARECLPKRVAKKNSIFVCFFLLPAEHKLYAAVLNEPSDNKVLFLRNKSIRFFLTFISLFSPFCSTYFPLLFDIIICPLLLYTYISAAQSRFIVGCSGRSVDASMQRLSRNTHATQLPNNE